MTEFKGLPPGPNVGTQLKALRRRKQKNDAALSDEFQEAAKPLERALSRKVTRQRARTQSTPLTEQTIEAWFTAQLWAAFPFQKQVWNDMQHGRSGLLHASTGSGKTYAVWLGALLALARAQNESTQGGTRIIWITPMRALAADTALALDKALEAIAPHWSVGLLTGDTPTAERARLQRSPPTALVTTPESLTVSLSKKNSIEQLSNIDILIVDEWHELIGNKRGVQLQLALARIAGIRPDVMVWGVSATLGNLDHAREVLLAALPRQRQSESVVVHGNISKKIVIDSLIPDTMERFPWGGHLGLRLLEDVAKEIDSSSTCLVFTNTRSQAEIWYQQLLNIRPEYAGCIALHHGSLDKSLREWVEQGLKQGSLKAVIATSSLDLGVDFAPVDRVLQIGSPKGVARLLQRAGRAGHSPGRLSRITIVPTNALELLEVAAARHAAQLNRIEQRQSPIQSLDVLVQHLVTIASGPGFMPDALYAEITSTYAYRDLSRDVFQWAVDFVVHGGQSLTAYPEFQRVQVSADGLHTVERKDIARRHVMSIGTIMSDASMNVAWATGGRIGSIEESFIARLKPGDCFTFSGRVLELIRIRDMTAYVKKAAKNKAAVPQWQGGKMPLSTELSSMLLDRLVLLNNAISLACENTASTSVDAPLEPELAALLPLAEVQAKWSALPQPGMLLVEEMHSKEGHHLFVYPFAGRTVNTGLASLFAYRVAQHSPCTFSMSMNDYGFELLSATPIDWQHWWGESAELAPILNTDNVLEDVVASLNASELAQRRFREIARIAGLIFQGYPGAGKSAKQLQASSGLFFDVFRQYEPDHLLLSQAQQEALEHELDIHQLEHVMRTMRASKLVRTFPKRATPFAFPLMVERLRERVSTEKLSDRVQRMLAELEKALEVK